MIKIFSVDDSDKFLEAIAKFFEPFPDQYELVGRFGAVHDEDGVEDMLETIEAARPDVVLMDFGFQLVNRPEDFGIELIKRILKLLPEQKIIVLTSDSPLSNEEVYSKVRRSFQAGAISYLRKDEPHKWLECVRETVNSGKSNRVLAETFLKIWEERITEPPEINLTDREVQAIQLLADGKRTNDIAAEMNITYEGANYFIDNAKLKLGVNTLQGLVAKAFRTGIII